MPLKCLDHRRAEGNSYVIAQAFQAQNYCGASVYLEYMLRIDAGGLTQPKGEYAIGVAFFVNVSARIYLRRPTLRSAALGLGAACIVNLAVMVVLNLIVVPLYTGVAVGDVMAMMVPLLLPFNLIKGLVNSVISFLMLGPAQSFSRR